jgi:redox-sensitive transcriptional activator SoxR
MNRAGPLPRVLSVGELARRSGVSVSALHFWEREGLIHGWRSAGNQRRYERATLRRVAIIKVAQAVGIPLAEVKARLEAAPAGSGCGPGCATGWRAASAAAACRSTTARCATRRTGSHRRGRGHGICWTNILPSISRGGGPLEERWRGSFTARGPSTMLRRVPLPEKSRGG